MPTNPLDTPTEADVVKLRAERIEDYLDHLCVPLLDEVPIQERRVFRAEAEDHLYSLAAEQEAYGGRTADEATVAALRDYGEPWQVGKAFFEVWQQQVEAGNKSFWWKHSGTATLPAFVLFGLSSVTVIGTLQVNCTFLKPSPTLSSLSTVLIFVLPILAGCAVGYRTRTRPARTVCIGLLPVLCHSLLTGYLLSPYPQFRELAVIQCVYWLPAGSLFAVLTTALRQHHRRQTYLQRVRV